MATYTSDAAQSGQLNGTAVTPANSGGGTNTAFQSVTGTVTFDNTHPWISSQDYHFAATVGVKAVVQLNFAAQPLNSRRYYSYFTGTVAPSATQIWCQLANTGVNWIGVNTAAHPVITLNSTNVYTSTYTLLAATQYRVEVWWEVGTSADFHYALYIEDAATPVDSYDSTTANTGTTNPSTVFIGKQSTAGNWTDQYISLIQVTTGVAGFIGPAATSIGLPNADVTTTGWTFTSGSTAWNLLSDGNNATYITSPANPVDHPARVAIGDMSTIPGRCNVTLFPSADAASGSVTVEVYQGATLIKSQTFSTDTSTLTLTTTPLTYVVAFTPAERAAITDPDLLEVKAIVTAA